MQRLATDAEAVADELREAATPAGHGPQKVARGRTLKDRSGRTIGTLLVKDRVATVRLEKEVNEKAFSDALVEALGKLELRTT